MITAATWKHGFSNGVKTTWMLLRIVIPVYALMTVLGHTPLLEWISRFFEPVMSLGGLPGGAALAFVTGATINIYAAMGIILALNLDPWQLTTMALMLNICHELPVESAVLKKTGITVWPIVAIRLGGAFAVAAGMNWIGGFFL